MTYTIYNLSKKNILLENTNIADNFFTRLKGLLGKSGLEAGEGLIIKPCNSIHTIGMKFPIDVAFIDKNDMVVHIMRNVPTGKLKSIIKKAKYVIEARAGEYEARELEVGDSVKIGKR